MERAPIEYLVQALGELPEEREGIDSDPSWQRDPEELKRLPDYHYKTGCYDDPEVVARLHEGGLHYESLEIGATRWLVLAPRTAWERQDRRVPLLVIFHRSAMTTRCGISRRCGCTGTMSVRRRGSRTER